MKKKILLICLALGGLLFQSCEDYLDVSPEAGLSEKEVFGKYANIKRFINTVYWGGNNRNIVTSYPMFFNAWDQRWGLNYLTDIEDQGRDFRNYTKHGIMGGDISMLTYNTPRRPIWDAMFKSIRIANLTLENSHMVQDAPKESDIQDLRGQAYFVRAYCHMVLANLWGPMPYLDFAITGDDAWDYPRLSKNETYKHIASDLDSAYVTFKKIDLVRRDPGPGKPGHLEDTWQGRPAGMAAKALRSRALLYAASPLNNANGVKDYEEAAIAAWEAIKIAKENEYSLLPMSDYSKNYRDQRYTNEQIWAFNFGTSVGVYSDVVNRLSSGIRFNKKKYLSGNNPTQNVVDMYETKWGDPLNTEADRKAAADLGHYNEQNPYADRDPRFYENILYNQAPIPWPRVVSGEKKNTMNIYYTRTNTGSYRYATHLKQNYAGVTRTGYYSRKALGDVNYQNQYNTSYTDPLIRLAELYLNYAEAANEAYGPNGKAPGASLSAVDAINIIRNRANMPNVDTKYCSDKDTFRERIRNERTIEFDQEGGHRYFDIRRWKIAPKVMNLNLMGVDIEKVEVSEDYPTGFKYTRKLLPSNHQGEWKDEMYYLPLSKNDYYKFKLFDVNLNPIW